VNDSSSGRPLRQEEQDLLDTLLSHRGYSRNSYGPLEDFRVKDMADGGMGSVRFVHPPTATFGSTLVEAQYSDLDGILVTIALNIDQNGHLFELDFWKVDFYRLKKYPKSAELVF
jgi:hypothetical protein